MGAESAGQKKNRLDLFKEREVEKTPYDEGKRF